MRPLLLAALLLAAPAAQAARPTAGQALLDDATTFRSALPAVAANLTINRNGRTAVARFLATESGSSLSDEAGRLLDAGAASPDLALRLLFLALDHSKPSDALAPFACRLSPNAQGLFLFAHPSESLIVARVGDLNRCWLGLEPELGRPREWAVQLDGLLWMVRIATYSSAANGWFPERLDIVRNGEVILTATVTSVAPTPADLPPLALTVANPIALPAPTVPTERASKPSPLRLPL